MKVMITKFEEFITEKLSYYGTDYFKEFMIPIGNNIIRGKLEDFEKLYKKYKVEDINVEDVYDENWWRDGKRNRILSRFNNPRNPHGSRPIVVSKNSKGKLILLCGQSAINRAHDHHIETIKAHIIPEDVLLQKFKQTLWKKEHFRNKRVKEV